MIFLLSLLFTLHTWASVEVVNQKIHITNDERFESKLEIKKFGPGGPEAHLKETGQIVANSQVSFENDKFVPRWVSLDETALKNEQIDLKDIHPAKGLAYGVLTTSLDFETELKAGQNIVINRYGLKDDRFSGKIIKVVKPVRRNIISVHFLANGAPELIAGTTCEVDITHIKKRPSTVSVLSLLHLGLEDYIVIKERDGLYYPRHVTILDEDSDNTTILVPVNPEQSYVARGAILLKPLLNQIIQLKGHE